MIGSLELLATFETLDAVEQQRVLNRAAFYRYGPTGMGEGEAVVAAMQERHDEKGPWQT